MNAHRQRAEKQRVQNPLVAAVREWRSPQPQQACTPSWSLAGHAQFSAARSLTRFLLLLFGGVIVTGAASTAPAPATIDGLQFFVGSTESITVTKVMLQKPFVTHWVGRGKISPDGSLELVQHVKEEGGREFDRRWNIRQVAPRRFAGTMSEASGPVSVDRIGDRYRFRFAMKGNLSVEQWLTPQRDMTSAQTQLTVRKLGIAVVHATGWIRRTNIVAVRDQEPPRRASS